MTLAKGKHRHRLAKHIDHLDQARVQIVPQSAQWWTMQQVGLEAIAEMRNDKTTAATGTPRWCALENGKHLIVHPAPDRKMECRVDGSVRVCQ